MLEGLVAWVINNYLGKYVENLNTDQLSIAILQGAVELENLPLKKDALRQVGLPIQVRAGLIGKVKLKIPVSQITSAPWEIYMEKLYLVAGPIRLSELDEEVEEQALQDYKLGNLDALEALWRSETETSHDTSYYATSYSSWFGLSMNFAANIIENLQLNIKDVHMRFEDDITIPNKIFASGVHIDSLSVQSCDNLWNPCFISSSNLESFKLMEMSGFSVYWDQIEKCDLWGDLALSELAVAMNYKKSHDYILSPVNAKAQVKRNRSELPLRSRVNPRIVCDLTLDQVPLSLTETQYSQMVGCKRGLISLQRRQGHIRSRPNVSVKENPTLWWHYAIGRILKPRPTWEIAKQRAKDNVEYVKLYTKLLSNGTSPLLPEIKAFKDRIEWERDFEELKVLRGIAMSRTRPNKIVAESQGVSVLASWFPGWWGSQSSQPSLDSKHALEEQLLDALADSVENNTILKRDTVFGQFNFTLRQGAINLCSNSQDPLMELQFQNVTVSFESRPRTSSHCFNISLGALYLKDHLFKDSAFPVLISPQRSDSAPSGRQVKNLPPGLAKLLNTSQNTKEEPLFQFNYEYKPFNSSADRRLEIKSKSLDVVYNPGATKWIVEFFTGPHLVEDSGLRQAARQGYHAVKRKTKQQILSNWDQIVYGHSTRRGWDVELDISAPQIFLVEHFNDKNALLCVVDFGKLHFTNRQPDLVQLQTELEAEEEEEAFQTPCSTPPGSEASSATSSRNQSIDMNNLNELLLHHKLYERYTIELSDLQILVGCVRDNWKYAHVRGTSSLHILDKFNISLQMERRVVHTIDPQFPSLTITGNLPKLVAHVNEDKVKAIRTLVDVVSGKGLISSPKSQESTPDELPPGNFEDEGYIADDDMDTGARLLMVQFSVDQMALEVQSRGRSVAELQVNGVKVSFTKRPFDTSITLSVHGLLLVDALQTFGPDFELLVASHKHVGMDSVSGSLQDSEPTSPTSPASPEPETLKKVPTSPVAISQALSSINFNRAKSPVKIASPPHSRIAPMIHDILDSEALISVEFTFINAECPTNEAKKNAGEAKKEHLQIANIQFNNLDIIANQETIVELVGFVHRVFPKQKSTHALTPQAEIDVTDASRKSSTASELVFSTRTELTFDFHRLNILLLRAVVKDTGIVGRKIATATLTEAKIHANVGSSLDVTGSLGGLQVLDLTPEGQTHQRILSLGDDPLVSSKNTNLLAFMTADLYSMSGYNPPVSNRAFSFSVKRSPFMGDIELADISIRMASVWYVHSPHVLMELKSCAVEFKQYLSNLFASIKSAATEMAMGIVHSRAEALAQSLSMGGRLYGSSGDISQTPRKRRSLSYSTEHMESLRGSVTPHSPTETSCFTIIKWDVVLASPVVILPRKPSSTQCVVAHLGSITIKNCDTSPSSTPCDPFTTQKYLVNITSMYLHTLDINQRLNNSDLLLKAEELYSKSDGTSVLHDTSLQFTVIREMSHIKMKHLDDILLESMSDLTQIDQNETLQIKGNVVGDVKFSLSRGQYEQMLETIDNCLQSKEDLVDVGNYGRGGLENIVEESEIHTGVSTLSMDPALRARMMVHTNRIPQQANQSINLSVGFELPLLTLELLADLGSGEQKFVELSFKDLIVHYERDTSETTIQISLHSVTMEDLQKPEDSKHRHIMVSSVSPDPLANIPGFVSKSCPNLSSPQSSILPWHSSLPDHLETGQVLGDRAIRHQYIKNVENSMENRIKNQGVSNCPYTPPPSPRGKSSPNVFSQDNLVHINIVMKPSRHPNLSNSRFVTVDFNCLDVIVNVESWVVVLDFFGISDIDQETEEKKFHDIQTPTTMKSFPEQATGLDSELELTVRSFSLLLNKAEYEVARAVMSNFSARLVTKGGSDTTETEASFDSFVLSDLTPQHSVLYRERFITAGLELSMTKYNSSELAKYRDHDMKLKLNMTSLVYVHTQRYIAEIQAFFKLFPHLRREVGYVRGNILEDDENEIATRILLDICALSPIIILPMSSHSTSVLVANLGNLSVKNKLLMSNDSQVIHKYDEKTVLLDVMRIELESMDLSKGERVSETTQNQIALGSYFIRKKGPSLLREKCHLSLQVDRNLTKIHSVPDMSIHGTLSTLAINLTLEDYKLISGLLSFNIGEGLDDLQITSYYPEIIDEINVWVVTYMKFDLLDVSVSLLTPYFNLACINFIKSSLTVDNYSNRTQDIDLVSQEILITDVRYQDQPANKRSNVFTNILQPIQIDDSESVQAQIHHRRNLDSSKFTILLNNMRLMAILDWWESVRDFIMTKPDHIQTKVSPVVNVNDLPFELKLNITDSEIVVVQDTSQWDTNAVILKSTTVITYRPLNIARPISFNLNHCEMFSCILGMEEETALSIIDPVTVNMDITRREIDGNISKVLKVHMQLLSLRLSYHDVRMFMQMLESLPGQTQQARREAAENFPANFKNQIWRLKGLGFNTEDCYEALEKCNGQIDDAAIWLTQHAAPAVVASNGPSFNENGDSPFSFTDIEVETDSICLCVIDDCRDADVPLVELVLNKLEMKQNLERNSGVTKTSLSVHYYNRLLSGWEPFIEPWSCNICWDHKWCENATKPRLELTVASKDNLDLNVTSSLVELYTSVKEIWTQDYYTPKDNSLKLDDSKMINSPPGYRRRSPYIPFALKNDTGSRLFFATITTNENSMEEHKLPDLNVAWTVVEPHEIVPFTFHERGKARHRDTHKLLCHQIAVRVEGWKQIDPVTVDRVGIYFRQAYPDLQNAVLDLPQARVVLEVTLEGSARKLVTLRSALQISNQLRDVVEIQLANKHTKKGLPMHLIIPSGETLSVPLTHAMALMSARPIDESPNPTYFRFSNKPIGWQEVDRPGQVVYESRLCQANTGNHYRFCAAVVRENYPVEKYLPLAPPLNIALTQPAHSITLLPPLTVVNLLPYELFYTLKDAPNDKRVVKPGMHDTSYKVDLENIFELTFNLENFTKPGVLQISGSSTNFIARIKLYDQEKRRLYLHANVISQPGACVKVTIYAPFWLLNKTAIPLVFRQEGVSSDTAGQYEEHEVARMVAPLLFSFSDNDSNPTVTARVGMKVHDDGTPQFCRAFTLQPGVFVRRLKVSLKDNRPDLVYMIGIEVRKGRGRYSMTNIVTLSAHYQLHNKSSYKLQFAQKCFASTINDPGAQSTYLTAVQNCSLPFHWPRLDKDQLLCVRLLEIPQCLWSGGFKIDGNNSFHLNIRNPNGRMYFLRIEIVLQGATYFIILTDADTMPPPIRIDNLSLISLSFHQDGLNSLPCTVRAKSSIPYAWDEPTMPHVVTLSAPGGVHANYDMNRLGEGMSLTYENFIYIAFTGTFKNAGDSVDMLDVECQQLVLDVPDVSTGKVVLSRKIQGERSQLWRMTADGHLQHEGSAPPRAKSDKIMVLDICDPAPQPKQYVGLKLQRPDKRRSSTQSWRFTEDGRLCCVHNSMCVQAKDGFYGLQKGSDAVLGPPQPVTYQTTESGLPLEQAVSRQRLWPGSGYLAVHIEPDGPTRVLKITDIKEQKKSRMNLNRDDWARNESSDKEGNQNELELNIDVPCLGVSLISKNPPEELIYARLSSIKVNALFTPNAEYLDARVQDIQVDNQVFEAQCPVVLYVTPISRYSDPNEADRPAFCIKAERTPSQKSYNADIYRYLTAEVKNMSLIIDERLLLKLVSFLGWYVEEETEMTDESDFETRRILAEAASVHAKRYYFGFLKIIFSQVRLSVITSNKLSDRLLAVKKNLGWTLIRFEDAAVELEPFSRKHCFESPQFIINSILKHYKDELKWQAATILVSVDFLGNPLGFVNDLSEGVTGLLYEGNVKALVRNVTHGISNSAAKVTETLGDGIGRIVFDDTHEERRQKIRAVKSGSSSDHLVAGLKGFSFGILGGVTSVFKQTYEGYSNDGIQGTISGLAKGLVGTVTKPVVGVLDLASETASAVRDSSKSSSKQIPSRRRLPRCVTSPSGFLPPYNKKQSQGQEFLYKINNHNYSELFMAYEVLRSVGEDLRIVISSENVRVFSFNHSSNGLVGIFEKQLDGLYHCRPLKVRGSRNDELHYIELTMKAVGSHIRGEGEKNARVRCDSDTIASWVSQQLNFAKGRHSERQQTLLGKIDALEEWTNTKQS